MKLRLSNNNMRIRLRKSDVSLLMRKKELKTGLQFSKSSHLTFRLAFTESETNAEYKNDGVNILLNDVDANEWMLTEKVSLNSVLPMDNNGILTILIEKDFPCKDTTDDYCDSYHELQSESFHSIRK